MEKKRTKISFKPGALRDAIRAHRVYKKEWQEKMEAKLSQMEADIQNAKADPFYKIEVV
jgi:hypothetical protein